MIQSKGWVYVKDKIKFVHLKLRLKDSNKTNKINIFQIQTKIGTISYLIR